MMCEIALPEEWPPGLAIEIARMIRQSVRQGFPIVVPVRKDATPDEIRDAFERVKVAIGDAGLAA